MVIYVSLNIKLFGKKLYQILKAKHGSLVPIVRNIYVKCECKYGEKFYQYAVTVSAVVAVGSASVVNQVRNFLFFIFIDFPCYRSYSCICREKNKTCQEAAIWGHFLLTDSIHFYIIEINGRFLRVLC